MDYFGAPFTSRILDRVFSPNLGAELVVVAQSFGVGVTVAELEARTVLAEVAELSHDGKPWIDGWHSGPESGEAVYVEKHVRGGASFHGYVDAVSRRIVQVG